MSDKELSNCLSCRFLNSGKFFTFSTSAPPECHPSNFIIFLRFLLNLTEFLTRRQEIIQVFVEELQTSTSTLISIK